MTNLSVRKLDEETLKLLRIRAAHHGVSMEEEVRQIISRAVSIPERLGDMAVDFFGKKNGVELELPCRDPHQPADLQE